MQISRTMYCEHCHKAYRPKANQVFAVKGSTSEVLMIKQASIFQGVTRGFTPHLITLHRVNNGLVIYDATCAMVGCGISLNEKEDGYSISIEESYRHVTTIKEWEALLKLWKDTNYEI